MRFSNKNISFAGLVAAMASMLPPALTRPDGSVAPFMPTAPTVYRPFDEETTTEMRRKMALAAVRDSDERIAKAAAKKARREANRKGGKA